MARMMPKQRPLFEVKGFTFCREEEISRYMSEYNLSRAEAEQAIDLENYADRIADSAGDCY
jgi:hypothetical protein